MEQDILNFLNSKKQLTLKLREWVKNKKIPLFERWRLFHNSGLGEDYPYYITFKTINEDIIYMIDKERYEKVDMQVLINFLQEPQFKQYINEGYTIEDVQEEILEKFIKCFEYDW